MRKYEEDKKRAIKRTSLFGIISIFIVIIMLLLLKQFSLGFEGTAAFVFILLSMLYIFGELSAFENIYKLEDAVVLKLENEKGLLLVNPDKNLNNDIWVDLQLLPTNIKKGDRLIYLKNNNIWVSSSLYKNEE